jgi:hypothetical protein
MGSSAADYRSFFNGGSMADQIVVRDVARIILPFSFFIGLFSHGAVSAAGFGLCALCIGYQVLRGQPKRALSVKEFEGA